MVGLAPWRQVALLAAAAGVSQAFGRFTYSLLFTDLRDGFAISNTVAGAVGSANLGAYLVGTLTVSLLVGRLGLVPTLRIGIVGSTSSLAVLAWSPSLGVTLAAMTTAGFFGWAVIHTKEPKKPAVVMAGFFGSFVWITAPGLATSALGADRRGLAIGITGAGIGVGIVASSALASSLEASQWRQVYAMEAVVGVIVAILVMFLVGNDRATAAPGLGRDARHAGLASVTEVPGWVGLVVAYGMFALAMSLIMTFTVAVLEQDALWAKSEASFAFTTIGIGTIVGGPVFGPMSDRLGRGRVLVAAFLIVAITGVLVPLGLQPWTVLVTFCFGMAFTGVPTMVAARISDVVDAERFGAAFGAATLSFGLGLVAGPQLGGYLADATGSFRPSFWVVVGCAIVGSLISWHQPHRPLADPNEVRRQQGIGNLDVPGS